ncbi:sugar nucleotide-binding protein [Paenibacillus sp. Soil787]|uniref:sugar nucleotide-binding protein n=1 Tax=Paenibacillus sp. Soil787 TaxID=1736411 RepID=UPI0009E715BE|nr:sugar nucleotide-binding protein [Paenibacillus sp. Soil787]
MQKILVLGSTGMAGHVITMYFESKNEYIVDNISNSMKLNNKSTQLDLTNLVDFEHFLEQNKYDYIINCVGVLNHFAEENKDKAILLNSYLPRYLEKKYMKEKTKIIHLSTDCVFSGKQGEYQENSFRDGDTFYDRSKILGEINNEKDITIRTSIIGPDINPLGIGLFNWFMHSRGEIKGYSNAYWSGITTIELARGIEEIMKQNISGLYHLVAKKKINKHDLLTLIKDIFNKNDVIITKYENQFVDKSLINTREDFDYSVNDYIEMINEISEWVNSNHAIYEHYMKH